MKYLTRMSYMASIREDAGENSLAVAIGGLEAELNEKKRAGALATAGVFRYKNLLFVYLEPLSDGPLPDPGASEGWLRQLFPLVRTWPAISGADRHFVYMTPVFWHDEPVLAEDYVRGEPPERRCGRIALLRRDKLMSYVTHHQALVREGLLVGDRYQFISIHENLLFSYFETPRDRERVNIRRSSEHSQEINSWLASDPDAHFIRFPESPDSNFHIIETLISV